MTKETTQQLSTVLTAKASIALPEIVSVFIGKYEDELYIRKDKLSEDIGKLKNELELLSATVANKANFKAYGKLGIAAIKLTAKVRDKTEVQWDAAMVEGTVEFVSPNVNRHGHYTRFTETVTAPITKPDLSAYTKIQDQLSKLRDELNQVLKNLGDMSRKERQVKARISELRLEEQGLTDFLQDKEILALISPT
jgi:ElaB/YqjD/DUF883 family membrane-anchored ribosome-binding protein